MGYDIRYLYPKTLDQNAGNYWFYEGDRANNTLANVAVDGFFNGSNVRDGDLVKIKATDGDNTLGIKILNGNINTEPMLDLSNYQLLINPPVANNIVQMNSSGQVADSGFSFNTNDPYLSPSNTKIADTLSTKTYIDLAVSNALPKKSVALLFVTNQTLSGLPTQGGYTCVVGDRVLCNGQNNSSENLIYNVNSGAWTVATDSDTVDEIKNGYTTVTKGDYFNQYWQVYNITPANGNVPPTLVQWTNVGGISNEILVGTIIQSVSPTIGGYLLCDGGTYNRADYLALFNLLNIMQGTATLTIANPCVITRANHGLTTGQKVYFTTTGAFPTGLTANTTYWINVTGVNTFNVATSYANLIAGTYIATTGTQSGVHTVYLTIGSVTNATTFNVPDYRGKVLANRSTIHGIGKFIGAETHTLTIDQMPSHSHYVQGYVFNDYDANDVFSNRQGLDTGANQYNTNSIGNGQPHNNMQPTEFVYFHIKF